MIPVLVGFGGNVGDRLACLRDGLRRLAETPGWSVTRVSSLYETLPVGGPPQATYLNACVLLDSECSPKEALGCLQAVEQAAGRRRRGPNGPRTLDLDLLLFGHEVIREPDLEVPHPRMTGRAFVLAPAAEIAPDMVHPPSGLSLAHWARRLEPMEGVSLHGPPGMWT